MASRHLCLPKAVLSLMAVSVLLGGCGVYFHDPGLRDTAVGAQDKAEKLDLTSVITTARNNRQALVDSQVALLKRNKTLQADIRLAQAVTDNRPLAFSVWGSDNFQSDLEALGVPDNQTLQALDGFYSDLSKWDFRLESRARRVEIYLDIMPTPCLPDFTIPEVDRFLKAVDDAEVSEFELLYNDYRTTCMEVKEEWLGALSSLPGHDTASLGTGVTSGLIAETWNAWKTAEEDLELIRAVARQKLVELKAAQRELRKASAAGADLANQLTKAAEKLKTAVKAFDVVCETGAKLTAEGSGGAESDGNFFSNSIVCGEKREALGQLIEAVASGQDPTAEDAPHSLKRAAFVAAALPGLVGDVGAALEAGNKVPLSSLKLLQAQASIDLEFADRRVARQEERVAQAKLAWRAALARAHHLWQTRNELCKATNAVASELDPDRQTIDCKSLSVRTKTDMNDPQRRLIFAACQYQIGEWQQVPLVGTDLTIPKLVVSEDIMEVSDCLLGKTLAQALADKSVEDTVKSALSHYYLATQAAEAAGDEANYRTTVVDGQEALDQDERALRLWAELIVVPVNSLATHYKGGVKPEVIADTVVTGAGLGAIAVGVN